MMQDFSAIRSHYIQIEHLIMDSDRNEWAVDPYAWDRLLGLTPIEYSLWCFIRSIDIVLYPQYPVGRYFVDFANPKARVAIECDGAQFHQDKEKDAKRQFEIQASGWIVYRFTGSECNAKDEASTKRRMLDIAETHRIKRP